MALPSAPISGGYELANSAGIHDRWTCPNCYAEHVGDLDDETVDCSCGARLAFTLDYEPVCRATCVDPETGDRA